MRILHVTESLDPSRGGPPAVVTRLAAAQAQAGHPTSIFAHESPGSEAAQASAWGTIPGYKLVCKTLAQAPTVMMDRAFALGAIPALRHAIAGADVVHLHEVWLPLIRVAAGIARDLGKQYIVSPHGTLAPSALAEKKLKKQVALWLGYRRMLERAAGLCVLNRTEASFARDLELGNRIWSNANGIFVDEISDVPPPGTFRAAHPALGSDPFIVFMSRLHPRKGIDLLIPAFAQLQERFPTLRLVLLGPDEGASAQIREQVAAHHLADRVYMPGGVWGRMKFAALAECAIYCLPSRGEGFSMSILEAMGVGAPVVITRTCNFPEAGEAKAALETELSADALAAAFTELLSDDEKRRRMAAAGRDFVLTRYTWPAIAQRSVEIYREAIGTARLMEPESASELALIPSLAAVGISPLSLRPRRS